MAAVDAPAFYQLLLIYCNQELYNSDLLDE